MSDFVKKYGFYFLSLFVIVLTIVFASKDSYSMDDPLIKTRRELSETANANQNRINELKSIVAFKVGVHNLYVDSVRVNELDDGKSYSLDSYDCNSTETVTWDDDIKILLIDDLNSNTACDLYF